MTVESIQDVSKADPSRDHLKPLTSARFFAAAMIVLHHMMPTFPGIEPALHGIPLNNGVSFFYVLSGFILAYRYPNIASFAEAKDFWLKRFARIWPMHLAGFLLAILIIRDFSIVNTIGSSAAAALNLLLVQTWIPNLGYIFSFNAVSWSLSVEAFFYLLFPLLIMGFSRTWHWKLALSLFAVILVCLLTSDMSRLGLTSGMAANGELIQFNPIARTFEFVLGMSTAHLWRTQGRRLRLNFWQWAGLEAFAVVLVVAAGAVLANGTLFAPLDISIHQWFRMGGFLCLPIAALLFVLASSDGPLARLLSVRPLVLLGEISFSLYVTHLLLLQWFMINRGIFTPYPEWLLIAGYCGAALFIAAFFWWAVEKPGVRLVRRFASRPLTKNQPSAVSH